MNRVKKPGVFSLAIVISLLILGSCAGAPPAPAPAPQPTPQPAPVVEEPKPPVAAQPEISQAELDLLLGEVQALKKKAFDWKLFEVLADDYKAAEGLYDKGFASYEAKDAKAAMDGLGKAKAAYETLVAKGIVELSAMKRKAAEDMKATALKTQADARAMDRFGPANEAYFAALDLAAASKNEEAIPLFESARLYFELAYKRARAGDLRDQILEKDYASWDSGNFQLAENKYEAEDGLWASGAEADRTAGTDALDEAILRYTLVVQKGREGSAVTVRERSDLSKARADEIKAHVAVKDLYNAARALYEEGVTKQLSGDFEGASESFAAAEDAFEKAYQSAVVKRDRAEAAMKAADEATAESGRVAEDGDSLISGQANP